MNFVSRFILKIQRRRRLRTFLPEVAGYEKIGGFLSPMEASHLFYFASRMPPTAVVVEIGSWKGKSTFCLARGLNGQKYGSIHAIDPFDASGSNSDTQIYADERGSEPLLEQFRRNLGEHIASGKVTPHVGTSQTFVGKFPRIDFLFIDGDHSVEGCRFDYEQFAPCIPVGGCLAFHDYRPWRKEAGPTFVIEQLVKPSRQFKPVGLFDTLWIARRIRPASAS